MKKLLLSIICALSALAGTAQTGVGVSNFQATQGTSATTATFTVSWTSAGNDSVWVFVDYNTAGTMKRLPLNSGSLINPSQAGAAIKVAGNAAGAWVVAPAAGSPFSATVQLRSGTTYSYGSCAYAIPQPPTGQYTAYNAIKFTGTPPFEVTFEGGGSASVPAGEAGAYNPAGKTIATLSDATRAPGSVKCKAPDVQTLNALSSGCTSATKVQLALGNTEAGATYTLYKDGASTGTPLATTTGGAATFSGTFGIGAYNVKVAGSPAFCAATVTDTRTFAENPLPAKPVVGTVAGRCNAGTVTITASSPGAEIDWYDAMLNGTRLFQGSNSYTTPSLTTNTLYYAQARTAAGCLSTARTWVLATVGTPVITRQPETKSACSGTETRLDVLADRATAYQWYSGSMPVTEGGGNYYYTTNALTATTTYKVVVANGACSVTSNVATVTIASTGCPAAGDDCTSPGAIVSFTAFKPCQTAGTGTVWYLTDTRVGGNNEIYKVRKMTDGKIWMVQDLKFGNCTEDGNGIQPEDTEYGTLPGRCRTAPPVCAVAGAGYMYQWALATVGSTPPCNGTSDECRGLCPTGWHLPTGAGTGATADDQGIRFGASDFLGLRTELNAYTSEALEWNTNAASCGLGVFYGTGYVGGGTTWYSSGINLFNGTGTIQLQQSSAGYAFISGYGKDGATFVRCMLND